MGYNIVVVEGEENSRPTKNRVATNANTEGKIKMKITTERRAKIEKVFKEKKMEKIRAINNKRLDYLEEQTRKLLLHSIACLKALE